MALTRKEVTRRYRERHPDRVRESQNNYQIKHSERIKQKQRQRRARNLKKAQAYHRSWMEAYRNNNKERYNEVQRNFRINNPAKIRQYGAKYRALKKNATVGVVDLAKLIDGWDRICGICLTFVYDSYDVDHIMPLSKGGAHSQENLQLTHSSCNRKKGNRIF